MTELAPLFVRFLPYGYTEEQENRIIQVIKARLKPEYASAEAQQQFLLKIWKWCSYLKIAKGDFPLKQMRTSDDELIGLEKAVRKIVTKFTSIDEYTRRYLQTEITARMADRPTRSKNLNVYAYELLNRGFDHFLEQLEQYCETLIYIGNIAEAMPTNLRERDEALWMVVLQLWREYEVVVKDARIGLGERSNLERFLNAALDPVYPSPNPGKYRGILKFIRYGENKPVEPVKK